jgi:flagellar motility protein MotE (MotC chaperone)
MKIALPQPRLLPVTMLALAALLSVKSVALLRVFVPGVSSGSAQAAEPAPPPAAAKPAEAKPAEAKPAEAKAPDAKAPEPKPGNPKAGEAASAPKPVADPPVSDSERALLLDLRKRRGELEARETALATREAVLSAAQARLATRVDELGGLQKRLEALEAARADRDEANWRGLVKLYETMKPKEAAAIFNDLDPAVLMPVLDRMKDNRVAAVFAVMLPDRARTATVALAKLRARANTIPPAVAGPDAKPAATGAGG